MLIPTGHREDSEGRSPPKTGLRADQCLFVASINDLTLYGALSTVFSTTYNDRHSH